MTTKQEGRIPIPHNMRREVIARDRYACRKCGDNYKLELHHLLPFIDGGKNEPENLVTLCRHCHREWEHFTYVKTQKISFAEWLELPPYLFLVCCLQNREIFKELPPGEDSVEAILRIYQLIRETRTVYTCEEELAKRFPLPQVMSSVEEPMIEWWKIARQECLFAA